MLKCNHYLSERDLYSDLKVFSTILVVIGHALRMNTERAAIIPMNQSHLLGIICNFIYSFHMPLFFFISGGVYGYCIGEGKYKSFSYFIINKVKRLMIPYFFWGVFYLSPVVLILRLTEKDLFEYILHGVILMTENKHLWYLPCLFNISILVGFIISFRHNRLDKIFLLIILSVLFWMFSRIFTEIFQISNTLYYFVYFILGVVFHMYYESNIQKIHNNSLILVFTVGLQIIFFTCGNSISILICSLLGIFNICSIVFTLNKWNVTREMISIIKNSRMYRIIKNDSFGIYLIHPMAIYFVYFKLKNYDIEPIILSIGAVIVSFSLGCLGTKILRQANMGIIIGENQRMS